MAPIKVAVLDDYQGGAGPFFKALGAPAYAVTIFKDTLLPYNHPDTPQAVKDELAARLEPFHVICNHALSPRDGGQISRNGLPDMLPREARRS